MATNKRFSAAIPKGYRIFFQTTQIAGVFYRKSDAIKAISGRKVSFSIEPEPRNKHDKNALKVIALTKGWLLSKRRHIGYIPKEIAESIATNDLNHNLLIRLKNVWVDDKGSVKIYIDILGLKSEYHKLN